MGTVWLMILKMILLTSWKYYMHRKGLLPKEEINYMTHFDNKE